MTEIHHAGTLRLYQPSNGSEGEWFISEWCAKCAHSGFDDDKSTCDILIRSMFHRITDPQYPAEWQVSNAGVPQCTAFTADQPTDPRCTDTPDLFESSP